MTSGLSGFLDGARAFVAEVRFAQPRALWLVLLVPLLGLLNRWAAARRRRDVARIGRPGAVAGQLTHPQTGRGRRRWLGLAYPLAWLALVVGVAGPRWGKSDETGVAVGRDVVIVIDLSRSMRADDMSDPDAPTRWQAARAGALDMLATIERRGGHRVAVIVFAAKAKVLCPLTTDYRHVRAVLTELDGEFPPPEIRPGADPNVVSGTRIGAALVLAVETHNPDFRGAQDIVLISDGDDPNNDPDDPESPNDREWEIGSKAAREAEIPIHTVGVGDPTAPRAIGVEFGDPPKPVLTRLRETILQKLADETRGVYVPAHRSVPALGTFFTREIEDKIEKEREVTFWQWIKSLFGRAADNEREKQGQSERAVSEDKVPQPKQRYPWFLAPALGLFLIGWLRGR